MTLKWGVDSVTPLDQRIRVRRGVTRRLYDHVCEHVRPPDFYGRYLNDDDVRQNRGDRIRRSRLRASEIDFLRGLAGHKPRLLLVYNDQNFMRQRFTQLEDPAVQGEEAQRNGTLAAEDAIARLRAIAREADVPVPQNVCIYADLERWQVSRGWMAGWMDVMYRSSFYGCGGLYWNVGLNYIQEDWAETVIGGFEDVQDDYAGLRRATAFRALDQTVLHGLLDTIPIHKRASINIWSNRPYLNVRLRARRNDDGEVIEPSRGLDRWLRNAGAADRNDINFIPEDFDRVHQPPENFLSNTCVWQYGANMPIGTQTRGMVDMNVATAHGFASMWQL